MITTKEHTLEFVAGWLLEFGSGPTLRTRSSSPWYIGIHARTGLVVNSPSVASYFDRTNDDYQINQAGLDFIKEGIP